MTDTRLWIHRLGLPLLHAGAIFGTIILLFWQAASFLPEGTNDRGPQCGHWALVNGGKLIGTPVSMAAALSEMPYSKQGHSFAQLSSAFGRHGILAVGYSESFQEFAKHPSPAIVHLSDPDHFVVAIASESSSTLFFDGDGRRVRLPTSEIKKRWTGNVLRLEKSNTHEVIEGPAIQFDCLYSDQGNIPLDSDVCKFEFPFQNRGDSTLLIEDISASCSCIASSVTSTEIAPGGGGVITLEYAVDEGGLQFLHLIRVRTNDPRNPIVTLSAAGNLDHAVKLAPKLASFGNIDAGGEVASKVIVIQYSGDDEFEVVDIRSSDPRVQAEIVELTHEELFRVWAGVHRVGSVDSIEKILRINIQPEESMLGKADIDAELMLVTNCKSSPEIVIPVRARILPVVRSVPECIHIPADHEGAATAFLVHSKGIAIAAVGSNADSHGVSVGTHETSNPGCVRLTLKKSRGNYAGQVMFTVKVAGETGVINVPIEIR